MHRFSDKLLVILLALFLVLSPLQSVMASFVTPLDKGEAVHQMAGMHGDMDMETAHENHGCDQCGYGSGCADHDCFSSQCASCVLAILPDFFYLTNHSDTPRFNWISSAVANRFGFSLFRPPRV